MKIKTLNKLMHGFATPLLSLTAILTLLSSDVHHLHISLALAAIFQTYHPLLAFHLALPLAIPAQSEGFL